MPLIKETKQLRRWRIGKETRDGEYVEKLTGSEWLFTDACSVDTDIFHLCVCVPCTVRIGAPDATAYTPLCDHHKGN